MRSGEAGQWWRALLPESDPTGAVTIRAGGCAITVRSDEDGVMEWLHRYLDGFWQLEPGAATCPAADVAAVVDRPARQRLWAALAGSGEAEPVTTFMAASGLRLAGPGPTVLAGCPDHRVAYARDRERLLVVGDDRDGVGLTTVRVVRSVMTAWLERQQWAHVHAAAAAREDAGLAVLGPKGAGKTAAIMALATCAGWRVIAHDRAFLGPAAGPPRLLPWPSSLNIGLGLLDALGWVDVLHARYRGGELPPYHQREAVTAALLAGRRTPVRADGTELKAQLMPAHVREWLGVGLGSSARLTAIVFPRIDLSRSRPTVRRLDYRKPTEQDVFPRVGKVDYFPDFLLLTGRTPAERSRAALAALEAVAAGVPAYRTVLGSDLAANANVLVKLV
ncbi:MAG TPA: hypothetical protein VF070_14275 [Streptosporangiaceae bacterium]